MVGDFGRNQPRSNGGGVRSGREGRVRTSFSWCFATTTDVNLDLAGTQARVRKDLLSTLVDPASPSNVCLTELCRGAVMNQLCFRECQTMAKVLKFPGWSRPERLGVAIYGSAGPSLHTHGWACWFDATRRLPVLLQAQPPGTWILAQHQNGRGILALDGKTKVDHVLDGQLRLLRILGPFSQNPTWR
jgi:hypothetical protein